MSKLTLDRILQSRGFGTRKWCAELIADGEVVISGEVITGCSAAIETEGLEFAIYNETWKYRGHHAPKTYVAATHDAVTPELAARLLAGVKLHDGPAPLRAITCKMLDTHRIEIVLEQGKYHQVKRMLAAADNHCIALRRTQIGMLELDAPGLAEGAWRYLDAAQLALLQ